MTSLDKDIKFLNAVKTYKKYHKNVLLASHRYKFLLRQKNIKPKITQIMIKFNNHITYHKFIPLGFLVKNSFTWINGINEVFYEHFSKCDLEKYISDDLISYLFKNKVNLHKKYRYIIPYLISITNPMYNITEYRDDNNNRFFGLVKLNINDNFNYDRFIERLEE
jgi:hypothetical protein